MNYAIALTRIIKEDTGCWIWQGAKNNRGYGHLYEGAKYWLAHRFFFINNGGTIPVKHELRHTCDVRLCVNPEHLITGTGLDNMQDAKDRGRKVGRNSIYSKETLDLAIEMLYAYNDLKTIEIITGINYQSIWKMRKQLRKENKLL